jgi:Prokaryotic cytochrome b561
LKALGRKAPQVVDKFNPGQKLNAIFIGAAIVVMLATGAMLKWFRFFPVDWRTGATFVHDGFPFAIFFVVAGHVLFALAHPESLRSMIKGWVTKAWAARHAAGLVGRRGIEGGARQGVVTRRDADVLNGFRDRQIGLATLWRAPIPDRPGGGVVGGQHRHRAALGRRGAGEGDAGVRGQALRRRSGPCSVSRRTRR